MWFPQNPFIYILGDGSEKTKHPKKKFLHVRNSRYNFSRSHCLFCERLLNHFTYKAFMFLNVDAIIKYRLPRVRVIAT